MTLSEKNPKRKKKQIKTKREMTVYLKQMLSDWSFSKIQNNVVLPGFCYREKDRKNGWLEEKKNFCPPPFVRCLPCLMWLLSWHNVHRQSGGHSAMCEGRKGGFDRGDVKDCCQPKRGIVVWGITWCVCFAPPTPLFSLFLAIFRQCCKRRTLATLTTTAQIFRGVYLTCQLSLACQFGS